MTHDYFIVLMYYVTTCISGRSDAAVVGPDRPECVAIFGVKNILDSDSEILSYIEVNTALT